MQLMEQSLQVSIGSSEIAINSVNGLIIADGAIDSAGKLASAIVSGAKLADNAIMIQE